MIPKKKEKKYKKKLYIRPEISTGHELGDQDELLLLAVDPRVVADQDVGMVQLLQDGDLRRAA